MVILMTIAVDKNSKQVVTKDDNEYIYIFNDEPLETLLDTGLHCLNYKYCEYVDINLTEFELPCFKQTSYKTKNWKSLKKHDYKMGKFPNYLKNKRVCVSGLFDISVEER